MLERLESRHVADVARIHESSWSPHEISVKLGRPYLEMFYGSVVSSPHAFGYVYTDAGQVVGYAAGFYDYERFNADIKKRGFFRLGFLVMLRLLTRRLKPADLRSLAGDSAKLRRLRYPEYHLGALALDDAYKGTAVGKTAITSAIEAVVDEFRQRGLGGCWGVCDDRNVPMKKYLVRLGFDEVDQVDYPDKQVVVFEKDFGREGAGAAPA